jgi:hypothetical protein
MGADLSTCPPAGTLERLLADQLAGPERDSVETHVERCAPCQGQLEGLVAAGLRQAVPAPRPPEPGPEPGEGFLSRLRGLSPPRADGPEVAPAPAAVPDDTWGGAAWLENGRLGQYEVLGRLGKGGMAAVFKARHTELGKVVALKVLPVEQRDEVSVARFKNEVRAIGRLDHPNIVVAHDAGESRGVHFLAMDFVDGTDLARLVERRGRLPVPEACEAARQAAVGLQHAHERGLVHRDVKPSNVMVDRAGRARLLDLGLARSFGAAADTLTARGALLGTADYLAPEQWDHPHAADTRADVYGLGCTLYHLLTGRPPFAGERYGSVLSKMRAHLEAPPPPLEASCPEAPPGLAAVLERMLAKAPADRYQAPAEAAEALRPFTAGADLARLLAERAPPAPGDLGAADTVTPAPGAWETDPDRRGRRGPPPAHRPARSVALAALCVLVGIGLLWLLWLRLGGTAGTAAKPLEIKKLLVSHYRDKGMTLVGDLRTSPAALRVDDDVQIVAEQSAPAYCYLIALNPDGTVQLCHPTGDNGAGAAAVRPARGAEVRYPPEDRAFVLDTPGLQAFVLAASRKPLPPYREWPGADAIPWEAVTDGGAWRWHFDGHAFSRFPRERGRLESREGVPPPLEKLREFFVKRPEFEAIQIIAFPVGKRQD